MSIRVLVNPTEAHEAVSFPTLPDDRTYVLEVTQKVEERKGPKGPYWNIQFKVVEDEVYNETKVYDIFTIPREDKMLNESGREEEVKRSFRLWGFLEAAGYEWGPTGFGIEDLIGLRVRCSMKTEEFNGSDRSRPDKFLKV